MSNNFNMHNNLSSQLKRGESNKDANSIMFVPRYGGDKNVCESNRGDFSQNLNAKDFQVSHCKEFDSQESDISQQLISFHQQNMYPVQSSMPSHLHNVGPVQERNFSPGQHLYLPQQNMCPPQQNMFLSQPTITIPGTNMCQPQTQDSCLNVCPPFPPPFPSNNQLNANVGSFGPINTTTPPPNVLHPMIQPPGLSSSQFLQPPFAVPCASPFVPRYQWFPSGQSCDKQSIQYWIQKWSGKWKKSYEPKTGPSPKISISGYKDKVAYLSSQIKELEKLTTRLQIMSKSLSDEEWHFRKVDVENQKVKVQEAMNAVKIIPLPEIQQLLKKRQSKRKYLKRKREEYNEVKKENKAICQLEHSRIDAWLEKMEEQVERARREEGIKKQADYVLSEVFHKKAEAKRMLSLLTTMGKLRNARIHDRDSKGEFVSKEAAESFNSIIENLKKRWVNQINGYNLEEQGLRVMLNDAEIKRSNIEKSLNKQILQQWLTVIFGEKHRDSSFQPNNVHELINARKTWDQYITNEDNVIGSSIPNGWILPSLPSNDDWAKHIKSS